MRKAEVQRIFLEVSDINSQISIVIDGLDECSNEMEGSEPRGDISQVLHMAASKGANILVAIRPLADISADLRQYSTVAISAKEPDLRAYVEGRLHGIEKRIPQAVNMKAAVVNKVILEAEGVFLLARLMMDLLAPTTVKNLRQIKQFLSKDCWNLPDMYRTTLDRIMSSHEASAELAKRMLMWMCYSHRPLHESELQHAIATEFDDDDFDPDGITPGEMLQDSCMGIVACDERGMYSLFHLTAYEFFRSSPELRAAAAHSLIAKTCIAYLSFASTGFQGACSNLESLESRKRHFPLLDYAAKNWGDHARQVEEELLENIISFVTHDSLRQASMQALYHRHREDEELRRISFETLPSGSSPLQVACGRGLLLAAQKLLQDGADPAETDDQGWTPLIAASSYCHLNIVNLLVSHARTAGSVSTGAVAVDQSDRHGWTPLFWATIKGH